MVFRVLTGARKVERAMCAPPSSEGAWGCSTCFARSASLVFPPTIPSYTQLGFRARDKGVT